MLFLKIAASFTSLIPSLKTPTDDREMTEITPTELPMTQKCYLLIFAFLTESTYFPKKVDSFSKKVVPFPEKLD